MKRTLALDVRTVADGIGMLGASVCAVHCIAMPTLLVLGAAVPTVFLEDEAFHRLMLWFLVPSAVLAFSLGCWRHRDRWMVLFGALGLTGIVLSGLVLHDLVGELGERLATLGSAALLVVAHTRNYMLCRSRSCRHDAE